MARAASQVALGKFGEDLACRVLRRQGYAIVARRYRTRAGELDIVAEDGGTLVFVEVKLRRGDRWGTGADAVTRDKRRRLVRMAEEYLARARVAGRACRFDVVAVALGPPPVVTIYRGAFIPGE